MTNAGLRPKESVQLLWTLCQPYMRSQEKWWAARMVGMLLALAMLRVWLNVQMNAWNGRFFDALQARDTATFGRELWWFFWLFLIIVVVVVQNAFLQQVIQIRWRRWQTARLMDAWLAARGGSGGGSMQGIDNPDQRIAEDVRLFTAQTFTLVFDFVFTAMNLTAFLAVLWRLSSGTMVAGVTIPGFLLWAALAYASASYFVTDLVGRTLIRLNFRSQSAEADFRFGLVEVRERAPDPGASVKLHDQLRQVIDISWQLAKRQKILSFVTFGFGQFTIIFPYLILAPQYLSGAEPLGRLVQSVTAFISVYGSLSWPVGNYAGLTAWRATADRVNGLQTAIWKAACRNLRPHEK